MVDTKEHTELGNLLRFAHWDVLQDNPFVHIDNNGVLHLSLQGIADNGLPEHVDIRVPAGVVVGMSGDYFGGKEVEFELPSQSIFRKEIKGKDTAYVCEELGDYLVNEPSTDIEEIKMRKSYTRLASTHVTNQDIDTIYEIDNALYVGFSEAINGYIQQIMFALKVKNYADMLNRNLSHFTPWSVRAYIIGHKIALKYARIAYELQLLIDDQQYDSDNEQFRAVIEILKFNHGESIDNAILQEYAHRYQTLALGVELFSFHYYSDHFAAGHGALIGDLRDLLPQRFGFLGGVLVNNLHDELNNVTVYTRRPYDPTPDTTDAPVEAGGDGDFDQESNSVNKQSCIDGMHESLEDILHVLKGGEIPHQAKYGGLEQLPDIDTSYRQPQPLFLLGSDDRIFYRKDTRRIRTLSPSQFKAAYDDPEAYGYAVLNSYFDALILVIKLRFFPFLFAGVPEPLSDEELKAVEEEERALNPARKPIVKTDLIHRQPVQTRLDASHWQSPQEFIGGLTRHGIFAVGRVKNEDQIPLTLTFQASN